MTLTAEPASKVAAAKARAKMFDELLAALKLPPESSVADVLAAIDERPSGCLRCLGNGYVLGRPGDDGQWIPDMTRTACPLCEQAPREPRPTPSAALDDIGVWQTRCRRVEQHVADNVPPQYWLFTSLTAAREEPWLDHALHSPLELVGRYAAAFDGRDGMTLQQRVGQLADICGDAPLGPTDVGLLLRLAGNVVALVLTLQTKTEDF